MHAPQLTPPPLFLHRLPLSPVTCSDAPGYNATADTEKLIPRHLWVALRNKSEELNWHMQALFDRNKRWQVHLEGNDVRARVCMALSCVRVCVQYLARAAPLTPPPRPPPQEKDVFMQETFPNTSLLWAYHQIHPMCGAAKADIWRYAVLFVFGGVYIDDDSDIGTYAKSSLAPPRLLGPVWRPLRHHPPPPPRGRCVRGLGLGAGGPGAAPPPPPPRRTGHALDDVILPTDRMVLTHEKNRFNGDACYLPQHHLSDAWAFRQESARDAKGQQKVAFFGRIGECSLAPRAVHRAVQCMTCHCSP